MIFITPMIWCHKETKMIIRELNFYTDGAYSSKSEMGGWACVCVEDDVIIDIED